MAAAAVSARLVGSLAQTATTAGSQAAATAGRAEPSDLFSVLQDIAAMADKGKTMTVGEAVASHGSDLAKAALEERLRGGSKSSEMDMEVMDSGKVRESFLLLCGGRGSGKSSLRQAFLGASSSTDDSTVGLEYSFGKKENKRGQNEVTHVWELAGGTGLHTLSQVPITAQRMPNDVIVLCASLQHPMTVLPLLLKWLSLLKARCEEALGKLSKKNSKTVAALQSRALKRACGGGEHEDK
jgi:hypothetical protein